MMMAKTAKFGDADISRLCQEVTDSIVNTGS